MYFAALDFIFVSSLLRPIFWKFKFLLVISVLFYIPAYKVPVRGIYLGIVYSIQHKYILQTQVYPSTNFNKVSIAYSNNLVSLQIQCGVVVSFP